MSLLAGRTTFRVRYAETDRMGVTYYANYLVWFEVGRTELMRQAGSTYRELEETGVALPIVRGDYTLLAPSYYDDEITVETRVVELKTRRIVFGYEVRRGETLLATGSTTHVPLGVDGRVVAFPDEVRKMLEPPEG